MAEVNHNVVKRMHREVRFGSYILGSTLGEGEFGKVKLGWRKDGREPNQVAIKLIKRENILKDSESEIKIHREINSLKLLRHPNIISLVEVMKSGKYIGIVLEYASGGELFDYILKHRFLKENDAKRMFAQLVSGVDYMHSKGLIHRDLKLENLLLDKHRNIIITDFGFVNSYNKDKNDLMKTSCGSPCYAAPELVLTQSPYEGKKVDIWSLGVILYAMLSGYLPFDDDPENEDGSDIIKLYHYICRTPLTFPEYVTPLPRDLLRKIIVSDPKRRISIDEIRGHSWLSPHANLLSIRQPEWDKIHRTKLIIPNSSKNYKRFSMIDDRTATPYDHSAFMGLYSNPSTSSSMANAIARSSTPTNPPIDSSNRSFATVNKHARATSASYTTASSALKAVVGEELPSQSNASLNQPIFGPPTTNSVNGTAVSTIAEQESPNRIPSSAISTPQAESISTTQAITAKTSMKKSAVKLNEQIPNSSAQKDNPNNQSSIPNTSESISKTSALTSNSTRLTGSRDSSRLPPAAKKPRPTSYHPTSMTTNFANSSTSSLLDFMKIPSSNLPISQLLSSSPTKSSNDTDSNRSSPQKNQRRNSVVTHVHVTGVLTSERNLNSQNNKRNSVLSYLEDKIDTLELAENHGGGGKSNTPQINQIPVFDSYSPGDLNREFTERTMVAPTPIQMNQSEQPKDSDSSNPSTLRDESRPADVEMDHLKISNVDQLEKTHNDIHSKQDETHKGKDELSESQLYPQRKRSVKLNGNVKNSQETKSFSSKANRNRRTEPKDVKEGNKENRDTKKKNRFSILSFYSNYNSSSTSINTTSGTSNLAQSHSKSSHNKKVLEPSDANVSNRPSTSSKEQVRISSDGSNGTKKSTSGSTTNSTDRGKEASAAKKVMDFFKRRSVKVG